MVKVRSLREALTYIKTLDKDTGISENAIRMLVVSGQIPSINIGRKYLVNVDLLVDYFNQKLSLPGCIKSDKKEEDAIVNKVGEDIRVIPERLKWRKTSGR